MIYHIISTSWNGYIEIEFNELGLMTRTDTKAAELSEAQQIWFLKKMPRELSELQRVIEGTTAKLVEFKKEITFEEFWLRYDNKIRSSKKESLKIWNKLDIENQRKAFEFIKKYEMAMPTGVNKKNCETYLRQEQWNN